MQQPKLTIDELGHMRDRDDLRKLEDFMSGRVNQQRVKPRTLTPSETLLASFADFSRPSAFGPSLPSPKSKLPPKEYAAAKSKKRAQRLARRKNRR
jgi:hypothetical protein